MCILFIGLRKHPHYSLIVAANRDEYFSRPSETMHHWPDHPQIFAGRDQLKGGSWLGINKSGQFCAVTNLRTGRKPQPQARSRGQLVTDYLTRVTQSSPGKHIEIERFKSWLSNEFGYYAPFNLVFGDAEALWVFSSQNTNFTRLAPGYHSISNGEMDQVWPKMSLGVRRMTELIESSQSSPLALEPLQDLMTDTTQANTQTLPDTGIGEQKERLLSSIFISGQEYGTRTTTLIRSDDSRFDIMETNYGPLGLHKSISRFRIPIQKTSLQPSKSKRS